MTRRPMASPRRRYEWSILRDALLMFVVVVVLIAATSTGY